MILGLGVDVFDVPRMERALHSGDPGLTDTLFTANEIADARRQRHRAGHYAACFACKEATFKALALDDRSGVSWHDVELRVDAAGAPRVVLHGRIRALAVRLGVSRVLASIARTRRVAAASAVLES